MNLTPQKLGSVLIVGTGGGNDIASTIFALLSLREAGWQWNKCSIAGVLSPFHAHNAPNVFESRFGIKEIQQTSTREVRTKKTYLDISFVDAHVSKLVQENFGSLRISRVFGLPLHHGSVGITQAFQHFITMGYDAIILVDIGGDILYRGKEDSHVLSPMFDAMVLKGFVDAQVPGFLFEAGLGTDGEIEPESIFESFIDTTPVVCSISKRIIDQFDDYYQRYIKPVRTGGTIPGTIQAFRYATGGIVTKKYRSRTHIGSNRWYKEFTQRIDTDLCKNFYLIDPTRINNPFAISCTDPIDWFIRTQSITQTNCEPNVEFFNHNGTWVQFVTPSPLLDTADREVILDTFSKLILEGHSDYGIMFDKDRSIFNPSKSFHLEDIPSTDKLIKIVPK